MKLKIVKTDKGYVAVSDEKLKEDNWSYGVSNKIIATDTSFKLEGIAQFKLEDTIEFPQDIIQQLSYEGKSITEINGFKNGYKAAQEKGCYSIEDMRKAYEAGRDRGFWEEDYKDGSKILEQNAPKFEVFIESLNQPKKLIAIEVDMTMKKVGSQIVGGLKLGDYEEVMNITESEKYSDGLLTIQKYYYE